MHNCQQYYGATWPSTLLPKRWIVVVSSGGSLGLAVYEGWAHLYRHGKRFAWGIQKNEFLNPGLVILSDDARQFDIFETNSRFMLEMMVQLSLCRLILTNVLRAGQL